MAWLVTGIAKTTPAETAEAMANALMLNTIRSSFFSHQKRRRLDYTVHADTRHLDQTTFGGKDRSEASSRQWPHHPDNFGSHWKAAKLNNYRHYASPQLYRARS